MAIGLPLMLVLAMSIFPITNTRQKWHHFLDFSQVNPKQVFQRVV